MHLRQPLGQLLATALSCVALQAVASPGSCSVVATAIDRQRSYANVVAAVDAMRQHYLDASIHSDREFVGAVVTNRSGGFWASVGFGCPGQDKVTFSVSIPVEMQVAAFWHTHGAPALFRDVFSPEDVDLVRSTGRDFYLITPRGQLKVLRPAELGAVHAIARGRFGPAPPKGAALGRSIIVPVVERECVAGYQDALQTISRHDSHLG